MAMPWFRMYAEFAADPKVQMLSEADQRRFVMLLCIRCSNDIETFHDEEVAFQLRIEIDEWRQTKGVLVAKKLIDGNNNPVAWEKRQFISDSSTKRVQKHREKMVKQACNVSVTPPDTDTDTDTEVNLEEAIASSAPRRKRREAVAVKKIDFDFKLGQWDGIEVEDAESWESAYPALNIDTELARAAEWAKANPKNKKSNWRRFLTNWFSKAQDRAPRMAA